jgi:hypothetical protein
MPKKKAVKKEYISREFFKQAGRKGGKVRAKRLSKKKRVTSAKKAAKARWAA